MRILHVIGSMDPVSGGPCQGIRNMDSEMRKMGVEREVVCFDSPDAAFNGSDQFVIHALGEGFSNWHYNRKLVPWLEKNICRFDVVIVNGLWLYHGMAVRKVFERIRRKKRKAEVQHRNTPKLFVMPHGMLDPYFQKAKDRRFKAVRNFFYWNLIEKILIQEADALLFTCQVELELASKTFSSYHPKKAINVGYGIAAPPVFEPAMQEAFDVKCPGLSHTPYLLFLSRVHEKKGVDLLLNAYLNLLRKNENAGDATPKLVIAGPGRETAYGKKMLELAANNPLLNKSVFFPGMLEGEEKWGAFYKCEAFVLPSHQENFGIAVVEALACGKPVLITDKINIWKDISNSGGCIVKQDNTAGIEALLDAWLALDKNKRTLLSKQAKETFRTHFDVAATVKKIIALN